MIVLVCRFTLIAKIPIAECPIAKVPIAKCPIAKVPIAECPIAKCPIADGPIAKCLIAQLQGSPPRILVIYISLIIFLRCFQID